MLGNFFFVFKINFFKEFLQAYQQSVKQFKFTPVFFKEKSLQMMKKD